jgi:hypothetical protein
MADREDLHWTCFWPCWNDTAFAEAFEMKIRIVSHDGRQISWSGKAKGVAKWRS